MGFIFPTLVAGFGWGDWRGGFFFAGAARLLFVHHSTFCVNSLAHWLGETPFDNKHSPRDHIITALVTIGEGYHNFHHQFPMDYRNAYWNLGYDPTKWLIKASSLLGLATHLKTFPENEIRKGVYTMKLAKLAEESGSIQWPIDSNLLPVISWDDFVEESKTRELMVIHGFIHDVSTFMNDHPGGAHLLKRAIGTDASVAFFGGVYDHSNAAHNQLAMMRVGILDGGMEVEHLKRPRASSTASASSASSATSAASSVASSLGRLSSFDALDQLASSEVSHQTSAAPEHQPTALIADKYTLHLPPSERLRIARTAPLPRSEFTVKKQQ
jgi:stearoyl-CoA desaturase (delta-9 desaturase)